MGSLFCPLQISDPQCIVPGLTAPHPPFFMHMFPSYPETPFLRTPSPAQSLHIWLQSPLKKVLSDV